MLWPVNELLLATYQGILLKQMLALVQLLRLWIGQSLCVVIHDHQTRHHDASAPAGGCRQQQVQWQRAPGSPALHPVSATAAGPLPMHCCYLLPALQRQPANNPTGRVYAAANVLLKCSKISPQNPNLPTGCIADLARHRSHVLGQQSASRLQLQCRRGDRIRSPARRRRAGNAACCWRQPKT